MTRLKRRHFAIPVSSFVFRRTSSFFSPSCIVKGSRSNGRWAHSPRCCKCQHTVRDKTGLAANMSISWLMVWLYSFRELPDIMSVLSGDSYWRAFAKIVHTLDRQKSCLLHFSRFAGMHFSIFVRHSTMLWANSDLTKHFLNEKYTAHKIFFLPPASSKWAEILIISRSHPLFSIMRLCCSSNRLFLVFQS